MLSFAIRIYYIRYIVADHNVALFGHMVVLRRSLLAVCIPCGDVSHIWERIRIIILPYCVLPTRDMITALGMILAWYLTVVLLSCPYLGHHLLEFINNHTQFVGKTGGTLHSALSPPHSPSS